ncbi:hypothetical protein EVAR_5068_1 [Eumeta japonica]|uniref:Uncharacterized protein n=1 Tax=Eumeta variegata TaxID=151549 RepID=A0A4C1SUW8_EUMVA|nr:hypothetical protein EVAR_5068_1 [Eumeta japonica]
MHVTRARVCDPLDQFVFVRLNGLITHCNTVAARGLNLKPLTLAECGRELLTAVNATVVRSDNGVSLFTPRRVSEWLDLI